MMEWNDGIKLISPWQMVLPEKVLKLRVAPCLVVPAAVMPLFLFLFLFLSLLPLLILPSPLRLLILLLLRSWSCEPVLCPLAFGPSVAPLPLSLSRFAPNLEGLNDLRSVH